MTYPELLAKYPPEPIETEASYQKALRQIEKLMTPYPDPPLAKLIEVLAILIEQYESREYPTPKVSPAKMLAHLMEVRGLKVADLAQATGISASTISSVRNENRGLSKDGVLRLAQYFNVSAEAFMETHPPVRKPAAKRTSRPIKRAVRFVQLAGKQGAKTAAKAGARRVSKPTQSKG